MSYSLYKSDGTLLTTVVDGTMDGPNQNTTTSGLYFAGANFVGYGLYLNENFVKLLENFASTTSPQTPNLQGQLWFNKTNQTLNVFTDLGDGHPRYIPVSPVTTSATQPATSRQGDIWYNQGTQQTFIYDSGNFNLVGPQYTKSQGISGAIPVVLQDGIAIGTTHNVVQIQFGNTVVATVSGDPAFTPQTAIPGFGTINPGITFSSLVANPTINSNLVGSVTGNLTGNVVAQAVSATAISGTLTGTVLGNVIGNVTATSVTGSLFGNLTATQASISNFATGNAQITGGNVTGLTNLSATALSATSSTVGSLTATSLSSGSAQITGGSISGVTNLYGVTSYITNFSTGNAQITGGNIINIAIENATTLQAVNFSSPNVQIGGGTATLNALGAGTGVVVNFSTANAQITGGNATGLGSVTASTMTADTFTANSATFTNGTINNLTASNIRLNSANLVSSVTTLQPYSDSSANVASTGFVHSVLPRGIILMWSGASNAIPGGWQLCDGSNGAPDLRGQFIVGAGGTYSVATQGGNTFANLDASQLPSHYHSVTVSGSTGSAGAHGHSATSSSTSTATVTDPQHQHFISTPYGQGSVNAGDDMVGQYNQGSQNTAKYTGYSSTGISVSVATSTNTSVSNQIDHQHSFSIGTFTGNTGSRVPIDVRPPYYALCYIMKITG